MNHRFILWVWLLLVLGCAASRPYAANNKAYTKKAKGYSNEIKKSPTQFKIPDTIGVAQHGVGTINFNLRKPNLVVFHHTAQNSCATTIQTFVDEQRSVSAHYVICKDGVVYQMLNDYLRGWHAGAGSWGSITDVNSSSIGIELDNDGNTPFPEVQIQALEQLSLYLKSQYNIPAQNFIAHSDMAPGRKVDPNAYFPWRKLAEKGIGIWYDTSGVNLPEYFDVKSALKIIGYPVNDLAAALTSFRLHFLYGLGSGEATKEEQKVMYAIMLQLLR